MFLCQCTFLQHFYFCYVFFLSASFLFFSSFLFLYFDLYLFFFRFFLFKHDAFIYLLFFSFFAHFRTILKSQWLVFSSAIEELKMAFERFLQALKGFERRYRNVERTCRFSGVTFNQYLKQIVAL